MTRPRPRPRPLIYILTKPMPMDWSLAFLMIVIGTLGEEARYIELPWW
jgi:hypothetical protein